MAYSFEKKGKVPTLKDKGVAERLQKEKERFEYATQANFWTCLCFKCEADRAAFVELTGLPDRRFVTAEELKAATEPFKPKSARYVFAKNPEGALKAPYPWAGMENTDDLEADCYREAALLLEAFRNVELHDSYKEATDSHFYIVAVFDTDKEASAFNDEMGLRKYGDKYLDASAWLKDMRG